MLCYCIGKMCDPVNGCNITSSGILHVFFIAFFLVCHLQLYINICKGLYLSLFLENPVTSFIGLAYKIVTTEHLNYEASISESKYHFVYLYAQYVYICNCTCCVQTFLTKQNTTKHLKNNSSLFKLQQ